MSATETAKQNMQLEKVSGGMPTEIGTTAAAAETKAMVESRFVMSLKKPRNMEQIRVDLLKECSRPTFALEDEAGKGNSALYKRPVGGGKIVEGLGIRFVELALQVLGNTMSDSFTIQESPTERIVHVFVMDLEKNVSWGKTITISKTTERLSLKEGEVPLGQRRNSAGKITYLVPTNDDSFTVKEGAAISKVTRTLGLRLIPGDLQDQCEAKIREVRLNKITEDPDAAMRKVIDGMAKQNVSVVMLEAFLDHPVSQLTPAEIVSLQLIYASLRDGETTWKAIMDERDEEKRAASEAPTQSKGLGVEATKQKMQAPLQPPPLAAPISVCGSCGATGVPLGNYQGVDLCGNCFPKPEPITSSPVPPTSPTVSAPAPPTAPTPPWQPTISAPPSAPVSAPAPSVSSAPQPPSGNAPPWSRPKSPTAPVAPQPSVPSVVPPSLTFEASTSATPTRPRFKSPNAAQIKAAKGVELPEFIDKVSDADGYTSEQLQRAVEAIKRIPGASVDNPEGQLKSTCKGWIGLPLEDINSATMECLVTILENAGK